MNEVSLSGSPYEIGEQYGRMLADWGFEPPPVTAAQRQFVADAVPLVADAAPAVLDELNGIADAGGWSLDRIRAVPLALGWDAGCTVVALSGTHTADGLALFGRNYDFDVAFADYATLFRTAPADRYAHVGCSDHWTGRHDGVNEVGLAVGHSFVPHRGLEPGVMFALAARTVLETCETTDDAVAYLRRVPHARNTNFLVADATGSIALVEAGPHDVETTALDGVGVATNHFQTAAMATHEPTDDGRPNSEARLGALRDWTREAAAPIRLEGLQGALADPTTGVCACTNGSDSSSSGESPSGEVLSGEPSAETLWSWAASLGQPDARLARGRPDRTPYEPIPL